MSLFFFRRVGVEVCEGQEKNRWEKRNELAGKYDIMFGFLLVSGRLACMLGSFLKWSDSCVFQHRRGNVTRSCSQFPNNLQFTWQISNTWFIFFWSACSRSKKYSTPNSIILEQTHHMNFIPMLKIGNITQGSKGVVVQHRKVPSPSNTFPVHSTTWQI